MREVYRFRSTKRLLKEPYQELQRQRIYFASPEQLNDPMEGFHDIVWTGDKIVWINLFKHYVFCLHRAYLVVAISGNQIAFHPDHISIAGRWDEPPTPQMGELFNEIWSRICDELRLSELVEIIATTRRNVRYRELLFYLDDIHLQAIETIQEVHAERELLPQAERPQDDMTLGRSILSDSDFFESIQKAEAQHEHSSEIMFSISYQIRAGQRLMHQYNLRNASCETSEDNRQLLLLEFPTIYVDQLDKLLWPQWYAACFARSYNNSSLWANYGDSHKGVCLIFEAVETTHASTLKLEHVTGWSSDSSGGSKEHWNFSPLSFHDVTYSVKLDEIGFFRNIAMLPISALIQLWYTDEEGNTSECASHVKADMDLEPWRKEHWADYERDIMLKSKDWEHEQECRLVLHGLLGDSLDERFRTLTYDFNSLKGIIFGIRTSYEDKMKTIEIIQRKCQENKRTDFTFFQAYYSPEHGDIRKYEILLKFADLGKVGGTSSI